MKSNSEVLTEARHEITKPFGLSEEQIVLLTKEVMDDLKNAKDDPSLPGSLYFNHHDYTSIQPLKQNSWLLLFFDLRCSEPRSQILTDNEAEGFLRESLSDQNTAEPITKLPWWLKYWSRSEYYPEREEALKKSIIYINDKLTGLQLQNQATL